MDHKLAEAQQSVEKYTLNELSLEERTQFEEHMFDCPVCSDQVRQNFTLTENLKEVLLEEKQRAGERVIRRTGWRVWLNASSLVPSGAALLLACVVGYQNFGAGPAEIAQVLPPVAILKPASRGTSIQPVQLDRKASLVALKFIADGLAAGQFELKLDDSDRIVATGTKMNDEPVEVLLPAKSLAAGIHKVVFHSDAKPADSPITYTFEVHDSN